MMASVMCKILTLFIICMALQDGCGLPLSGEAELPAQAPHPLRHVRTKRCSCNNWEDKECIYFCHLDIIWVNTPSKLLPYGLGSPPSRRRRRSTDRCECLDPADKSCHRFCRKSSDDPRTDVMGSLVEPANTNNNKLLASFRSVIKANVAIAKGIQPAKKNHPGVNKLKSRARQ